MDWWLSALALMGGGCCWVVRYAGFLGANLKNAQRTEFGQVVRFAYGLQKDISAVAAAGDTNWSNRQVEGQVNRLKAIKRQMYGRASFPLLRARVLPYSPAPTHGGPAP